MAEKNTLFFWISDQSVHSLHTSDPHTQGSTLHRHSSFHYFPLLHSADTNLFANLRQDPPAAKRLRLASLWHSCTVVVRNRAHRTSEAWLHLLSLIYTNCHATNYVHFKQWLSPWGAHCNKLGRFKTTDASATPLAFLISCSGLEAWASGMFKTFSGDYNVYADLRTTILRTIITNKSCNICQCHKRHFSLFCGREIILNYRRLGRHDNYM